MVHVQSKKTTLSSTKQDCYIHVHVSVVVLTAAFNTTLAEGVKVEKRLFYQTFATVSGVFLYENWKSCCMFSPKHLTNIFSLAYSPLKHISIALNRYSSVSVRYWAQNLWNTVIKGQLVFTNVTFPKYSWNSCFAAWPCRGHESVRGEERAQL